MTTTPVPPTPSRRRTIRWGDILIGGIGLAIAAVLFAGSATMEVRGQAVPGPQFFPVVVGILLAVTSGFLLIRAAIPAKRVEESAELAPDVSRELLRDVSRADTQLIQLKQAHRKKAAAPPREDAEPSDLDWKALGITAASVAGYILLLPVLGWIIGCTLLFAAIAFAFGSKRIGFNLAIGLLIGSIVQLVFSGLLGLALPAGFLGGI
ncbi:tripartite tricarboxylate transporter TctB family protein [Microbacterium sp. 179-B 1A2 NHS]|uniref:tripartite tricarboxylate transporter TctB family protein n=1 Tax=Microbacterium sp. 179-B 1A2 NHS TaxID=3142383 RepID=UPI0039A25F0C